MVDLKDVDLLIWRAERVLGVQHTAWVGPHGTFRVPKLEDWDF